MGKPKLTAAGLQVLKDAGDHALKVVEAREHQPPVDVVELLVKDPLLLAVLALKGAVGRDPVPRLDQAQVRPDDAGPGVLLRKLDGPDARAGPDVQRVGGLPDGRDVQPVAEEELPPVVLEICGPRVSTTTCPGSGRGRGRGVRKATCPGPRRSCSSLGRSLAHVRPRPQILSRCIVHHHSGEDILKTEKAHKLITSANVISRGSARVANTAVRLGRGGLTALAVGVEKPAILLDRQRIRDRGATAVNSQRGVRTLIHD